jgi:hypothetical protein
MKSINDLCVHSRRYGGFKPSMFLFVILSLLSSTTGKLSIHVNILKK